MILKRISNKLSENVKQTWSKLEAIFKQIEKQ